VEAEGFRPLPSSSTGWNSCAANARAVEIATIRMMVFFNLNSREEF
jgi:hypothetical protein